MATVQTLHLRNDSSARVMSGSALVNPEAVSGGEKIVRRVRSKVKGSAGDRLSVKWLSNRPSDPNVVVTVTVITVTDRGLRCQTRVLLQC